ncbi:MAG: NADH-quinone oxidoreductase subunit C [Alphaproteobacteria bacterium]
MSDDEIQNNEVALSPLQLLQQHIVASLGGQVNTFIALGELVLLCHRDDVQAVLAFLRDDAVCACQMLVDVCGADYPDRPERFEVVYNLLSLTHNHRIRVKTCVEDGSAVASVNKIYPSANWFEREIWDLYGVSFTDHPDLRRILTDYGFEGHPLRKDFPLTGFVETRYDSELKRVVYESVSLTQEFRSFDYISPWEGMTNVQLPGDEKAVKPAFTPNKERA